MIDSGQRVCMGIFNDEKSRTPPSSSNCKQQLLLFTLALDGCTHVADSQTSFCAAFGRRRLRYFSAIHVLTPPSPFFLVADKQD